MGIQITELLPKKEITLEDLKGKKIAVDASLMLYQFLSSIRQRDGTPLMDSKGHITSHLMGISTRIPNLMSKGLKLVFVFDGKPPALKLKQQQERAYRKKIAQEKVEEARQEEDLDKMYKYAKQTSKLSDLMLNEAKQLIKAYGLPVVQAPSEADAQAAFMNEKNDVYAVGSNDSDALVQGAPRLIRNLTLAQRRKVSSGAFVQISPELIELKQVLKTLKINQDKLIALSILVGTDYNPKGVKGIGPKNALRLIREFKSFDALFKKVEANFDWKKIFAIYKSMPIMKNYQIKFSKPNIEEIKKLLVDKHEFSEERVDKSLEKLNIKKQKEQQGLDKWV